MPSPPKRKGLPSKMSKRGSRVRKRLTRAVRHARRSDQGKRRLPYDPNRGLSAAPFYTPLKETLFRRAASSKGKVRVLDKGAGTGNITAGVKRIAPEKIEITALSVSDSLEPKNRPHIDHTITGIGLMTGHRGKYDVIYDCHGEDYHLPKELVRASIEKSLSLLVNGGELFTVMPLVFKKSRIVFTAGQGKKLVEELSARPDIVVKSKEILKRADKREYIDLVIHLTKK